MDGLHLDPNLEGVDEVYERLVSLVDGRDLPDALRLALRLNLILINHLGDRAVIEAAITLAAGDVDPGAQPPCPHPTPSPMGRSVP